MTLRSNIFILLASCASLFPQKANTQKGSIPEFFMKIDSLPEIIKCRNELAVNNQGGHLQGIQLLVKNKVEYAILSGSSDTYAYYAVVKNNIKSEVLSINILMNKPYKHAGGIQVYQDLMVVGIEDNTAKDKSKVCLYEIDNPEKPPEKPLALFERKGEPLRSTAGCTGITKIGDQYLVVVGDWNIKHLDFYLCDEHRLKLKLNPFNKVYTIDTERIDKSAWLEKEWYAYQNINLLKDSDGKLKVISCSSHLNDKFVLNAFD